jgi:CRISPR-associated endonuclease/helicase Cas3
MTTNAIKSSQRLTIEKNYKNIVHSKYTPQDKLKNINNLFKMYGKNVTLNKENVISAPIIKASLDISFQNVYIIINSPEDLLQIIGRVNRWGEYDIANVNIIINLNNSNIKKSEVSAIKETYNENLANLWRNFVIYNIQNNNSYNLKQLYELYNKFNNDNNNTIVNYIMNKLNDSTNNLSKIYPKKYIEETQENNKITVSKLRDNGNDKVYCIYKIHNTNRYTDPFVIDVDDVDKKNNNYMKNLTNAIKSLINDERFEYNKYKTYKNNNFDFDKLLIMATNEKTPYVSFDYVYHPKLGIVDKSIL